MLERNYAAVGGSLDEIRAGRKNIGSEALSSYVLHRASQENPFDLVGAMFIVEGLGQRIARQWGERIQEQLALPDARGLFLSVSLGERRAALSAPGPGDCRRDPHRRCGRRHRPLREGDGSVVRLQLEEIGNC